MAVLDFVVSASRGWFAEISVEPGAIPALQEEHGDFGKVASRESPQLTRRSETIELVSGA